MTCCGTPELIRRVPSECLSWWMVTWMVRPASSCRPMRCCQMVNARRSVSDTVGRGAVELEAGLVAAGRVRLQGAGRPAAQGEGPAGMGGVGQVGGPGDPGGSDVAASVDDEVDGEARGRARLAGPPGGPQDGGQLRASTAYFDEWVFCFNRRHPRSRGLLFHTLLRQAAEGRFMVPSSHSNTATEPPSDR